MGYCGMGLYCSSEVCVKLIVGDGTDAVNFKCGVGFEKGYDNKCHKFGSVEDGVMVYRTIELFDDTNILAVCKSGIGFKNKVTTGSGVVYEYYCDSIISEPNCNNNVPLGVMKVKGSINTCTYSVDGEGKKIYYYETASSAKNILFEDFIDDFNDEDLEEINSNEKYFTTDNSKLDGNKISYKLYKKFLLYKYAVQLQAAGLLDEEGEIEDDKDCEVDFLLKNVLGSRRISIRFGGLLVGMIIFMLL